MANRCHVLKLNISPKVMINKKFLGTWGKTWYLHYILTLDFFLPLGSNHHLLVGPRRQLLYLLQWAHAGPEGVWRPAGTDAKGLQSQTKQLPSSAVLLLAHGYLPMPVQPLHCFTFHLLFVLDVDLKPFPVLLFGGLFSSNCFYEGFYWHQLINCRSFPLLQSIVVLTFKSLQ